ncbi:RING/FYVE/PHD zinc finger-containing protein [Melia azedarach]|nr:RING/FYVE/PHD zinc finger-containing protein [Melia azedarach]
MNVCQKCGDKGDLKDLIYCVQCKVSAEHRYCLDILPKSKKEKVIWTCEECTPKDTKLGPVPSRRSTRICQAAEVRLSRKQMLKQISFSRHRTHVHVDGSPETKQSRGDLLVSVDKFKTQTCSDETVINPELKKKQRRLILEDGDSLDEESNQIKAKASQLVTPTVGDGPLKTTCNVQSLESCNCVHSEPIINPIWKGCFNINNVRGQTSVGILAHIKSSTCSDMLHAATALPLLVTVDILSKSDVWPPRFQISPPTDDTAVLHFFPEYESDEKVFDNILDDMLDHNLALKAVLKDRQLLVFSSTELPPDHWRICRKYYWWGVFEPIKHVVQSTESATTSKITNDFSMQEESDLAMTQSSCSPRSPLSGLSYTSHRRGSPFLP